MMLAVSGVLFAVFAANVAMGSIADIRFLSDVGEFLLLTCFSIAFVAAILTAEVKAKNARSDKTG